MNTLLSIANAALQYQRGKQTGLAGLFGIIFAVFCVFQWDHIYPILNTLGVVGFFDKLGLIKHGAPGLTGLNILTFFVGLYILLLVVTIILFAFVAIIGIASQSELVGKIIFIMMGILVFPFTLLYMAGYQIYYMFHKEKIDTQIAENKKQNKSIPQLLEENAKLLSREQALQFINRLPTPGDKRFMLGVTNENEVYMIIPRPIGLIMYEVNKGDLACEKIIIEKYDENKHKILPYVYKPTLFLMHTTTSGLNGKEAHMTFVNESNFVKFLLPVGTDFKNLFDNFSNNRVFTYFIKETHERYFKRKASLMKLISSAVSKEEFDELVKEIKHLNASNEEIIKMMNESESQLEHVQGD